MWYSFTDYCNQQDLQEMAQSRDDPAAEIHLDDEDRDFIDQAVRASKEAGRPITPSAALRARYTTLLQDKPGESGIVRFQTRGKSLDKWLRLPIERTHLKHLERKLRNAGLENAAERGFSPAKAKHAHLTPDDPAFYEKSFSRQNANDILKGKPIDVNYGVSTARKEKLNQSPMAIAAKTSIPDDVDIDQHSVGPTGANPTKTGSEGQEVKVRPVPNDWASSYLKSLFHTSDPKEQERVHRLISDLEELPGHKGMYDLRGVWDAVKSIVGNTSEPGKYILPEVWEEFEKRLPKIGKAIYDGVASKLREFDPGTLQNPFELRHALMQTTAMILSDPLRGNKLKKPDMDFLSNVAANFNDGKMLNSMARSLTAQGYVRKELGIKTTNTRKREYGGTNTRFAAPDVSGMGKRSEEMPDEMVQQELQQLEPRIDKIKAKLQRYGWDMDKLTAEEREDFNYYEELLSRQQSFSSTGGKARPTPHQQPRQSTGINQAKIAGLESKLRALEPQVQPIIAKLDAANWNTSSVTDDEWDKYQQFERLEKEIKRLKSMPELEVDDINAPAAASHHFRRNESVLGFFDWCKKKKGFE